MSAEYPSSVVMRSGRRSRGAVFSSAARLFRPASRVTAVAATPWDPPSGPGAGDTDGEVEGVGVAEGEVEGAGSVPRPGQGTGATLVLQLGWRSAWGPAPAHAHLWAPLVQVHRGAEGGGMRNGYLTIHTKR